VGLDQRGVTLIELLVVIVIFCLLTAAVISVMIFVQKLYISGAQQVDVHNAVRLTAERVIRELRFAHFLQLLDESQWDPNTVDPTEYSYIFYDPDTKTLQLLNESGFHSLSDEIITDVSFSGRGSTMLFTLVAEKGKTSFTLDSSVRLLNYTGNLDSNLPPGKPIALRFHFVPGSIAEEP
jgi:prepilin-type N-terminal cleavage/methylation domain-containing protein